ncbi:hypothetical protein F4604DRAFT_1683973 [Suillus subluteus]|nr:hypothetical protein F4604DRAFT_1683973 [Suillus subluteus]
MHPIKYETAEHYEAWLKSKKRAMHVTKFKNKSSPTHDGNIVEGQLHSIPQHEFLESHGMLIMTKVDREGWDSVKPGCKAGLTEAKHVLQQAYDLHTEAHGIEGPLTD